MAVRIRLTRVGATKQPTYRLVVADSRSARDGRPIETIGHYNPRTEPIELVVDEAKAREWMAKGAQPSDTVRRLFKQAGVNVNLAAWIDGAVHMRTYERGVEDETLSCGTGVTAAAWSARQRGLAKEDVIHVRTRGGALRVDLGDAGGSGEALLCGPVREVFTGTYLL